jgi:predicted nucleic acid-binding protein
MILLDTNFLIRTLVSGSIESRQVADWFKSGEALCTSSVVWYEFLCGPVDDEGILVILALLQDRILPFTADQASESARLFNAVGRKSQLRVDAMIAAAAIVSNAQLATGNTEDFSAFSIQGLRLVPPVPGSLTCTRA